MADRGAAVTAAARYDLSGRRVWVAGHRGMVGRALLRRLSREAVELLTVPREELDLTEGAAVRAWMRRHRPQVVILAAARVGGILANARRPVEFLEQNLRIELEVISASAELGVEKLLFLGSSCIYPRDCPQPIREEYLLTGPLEETNRSYALAKICGLELCRARRRQEGHDFIACMPTNLYGPHDDFDPETGHVLPALLRRFHEARIRGDGEVVVWGSGTPRREFLHVEDLAEACLHLLRHFSDEIPINIGCGRDLTIRELAETIARITGYRGRIRFDPARPDGTPEKRLDISRITALGWRPQIPLEEGIRQTYRWFLAHHAGQGSGGAEQMP